MLKKIDNLVFKGFIGPFLISFFIAVFVLIMQFLWLYIDEIAGKGVGLFFLMELISYSSVTMFPMALPIAVLLASVMVIGNLAEHYELSSMKSAGVSLLRAIRVLVFVGVGISIFSYLCSDFFIPIANLKFKSRLYDIRRQKPALTIEEGVFNEDFINFVIRIGRKERDNITIHDVLIEENKGVSGANFNQILADSGRMFTTADQRYFVMNLHKGIQYQEPAREARSQTEKAPFIRIKFDEWTKVFDLGQFDITRTEEDRFSQQRSMMNMAQLRARRDTVWSEYTRVRQTPAENLSINIKRLIKDKIEPNVPDTTKIQPESPENTDKSRFVNPLNARVTNSAEAFNHLNNSGVPVQKLEKPITSYSNLLLTFAENNRQTILGTAQSNLRGQGNSLNSIRRQMADRKLEWVKTSYELYMKYTFALVCSIFMFVGCSMGALMRKGGFGYAILVAISFFVLFIFTTIFCRHLADAQRFSPLFAAMLPCIIVGVLGVALTYFAMHDGAPPTWSSLIKKLKKSA